MYTYVLGMDVTKLSHFWMDICHLGDNSEKSKIQEIELLWLFQVHINLHCNHCLYVFM